MTATKDLPPDYGPPRVLDLARPLTVVLLTLGSVGLLVPFAWLAIRVATIARPGISLEVGLGAGGSAATFLITLGLATVVVPVILHEGIHGFFFWLFTRDRPKFALKAFAASAAAPDWHIPRGQYLIIGLAPLVLLTALGLALIAVAPVGSLGLIVLAIALHGAGTIGDVVSVLWLLRQPAASYFRDTGDVLTAYPPLAAAERA